VPSHGVPSASMRRKAKGETSNWQKTKLRVPAWSTSNLLCWSVCGSRNRNAATNID